MSSCIASSVSITGDKGGNFSSGHTSRLANQTIACGIPAVAQRASADGCCKAVVPPGPVARLPSMVLESRACPQPTPAQFALYPKVAVPESVRVQNLANRVCQTYSDPVTQRFAQYRRFQPAPPCQPLPPEANMAGISKPSTRGCPPWPR